MELISIIIATIIVWSIFVQVYFLYRKKRFLKNDPFKKLLDEIKKGKHEKELKKLNEHNEQRNNLHSMLNSNESRINGIACPKCGEELYDSKPMIILSSIPPKKNIHCVKCGYVGYRTA